MNLAYMVWQKERPTSTFIDGRRITGLSMLASAVNYAVSIHQQGIDDPHGRDSIARDIADSVIDLVRKGLIIGGSDRNPFSVQVHSPLDGDVRLPRIRIAIGIMTPGDTVLFFGSGLYMNTLVAFQQSSSEPPSLP